MHRVQIVSRPRHQVAGAALLVVRQRQFEQVGKIRGADVVFNAIGGAAQQQPHGVAAQGHAQGVGEDVEDVGCHLLGGRLRRGDRIDGIADQQRDAHGRHLPQPNAERAEQDGHPIGADVLGKRTKH